MTGLWPQTRWEDANPHYGYARMSPEQEAYACQLTGDTGMEHSSQKAYEGGQWGTDLVSRCDD